MQEAAKTCLQISKEDKGNNANSDSKDRKKSSLKVKKNNGFAKFAIWEV